jgi:hypothetical protein
MIRMIKIMGFFSYLFHTDPGSRLMLILQIVSKKLLYIFFNSQFQPPQLRQTA